MKKRILIALAVSVVCGTITAQKLSPGAQIMLQEQKAGGDVAAVSADGESATAEMFIRISDVAAVEQLEALGVDVHQMYGENRLTATVPLSLLEQIADIDEVTYVQISPKVEPLNDKARADAGADDAHSETNGYGSYKGDGVIVGMVDTGIEYGHLAFYDSDFTGLRISRLWDQNKSGTKPDGFSYGAEYTSADDILAVAYDNTDGFHGTHTSGIAAGADMVNDYYGVAPNAEIVMVSYRSSTSDIADAVQYIFDYADEVDKPCVVNLSLGTQMGPHDGTSDFDQIIEDITGPGRIVVGACGNNGYTALHAMKALTDDDTEFKTLVNFSSGSGSQVEVSDIWGPVGSSFSVYAVVVNTSTGEVTGKSSAVTTSGNGYTTKSFSSSSTGVTGTVAISGSTDSNNNRPNAWIQFTVTKISSGYAVGFVVEGTSGDEIHAWNTYSTEFTDGDLDGYTDGDCVYSVAEVGGTGNQTISVGSYTTRLNFKSINGSTYGYGTAYIGGLNGISAFSSVGPRIDGVVKPDITAPGATIISSTSQYQSGFSTTGSTIVAKSTNGSVTSYYEASVGTSMACPYVTGSVALWLQANPELTPDDILSVLESTARTDKYTGTLTSKDPEWGYGKIDTFEGLVEVLSTTGITSVDEVSQLFRLSTDRAAKAVTVSLPKGIGTADVSLYGTSGMQAASFAGINSGDVLNLSSLPSGVYVLKLHSGTAVHTAKIAL